MRVRVGLEVRTGPSFELGEFNFGEPSFEERGVVESNVLVSLLSFTIILLSYAMAPLPCVIVLLEAKSSSGSLRVIKPREEFF